MLWLDYNGRNQRFNFKKSVADEAKPITGFEFCLVFG
jgi:hypothetical protein